MFPVREEVNLFTNLFYLMQVDIYFVNSYSSNSMSQKEFSFSSC